MKRPGERTRRRLPRFTAGLFAVLLAIAGGDAFAAKRDSEQPVNIRARSVEANEKTGVSVYRDNVVLTQGTLRVEADRLEVQTRDGRLQIIRAWGQPVRLRTRTDKGEDVRGRAARVVYRATERRIDLYDAVELYRDDDVFRGNAMHYAIDAQTFTAEGDDGEQVSAIIQPAKPATE